MSGKENSRAWPCFVRIVTWLFSWLMRRTWTDSVWQGRITSAVSTPGLKNAFAGVVQQVHGQTQPTENPCTRRPAPAPALPTRRRSPTTRQGTDEGALNRRAAGDAAVVPILTADQVKAALQPALQAQNRLDVRVIETTVTTARTTRASVLTASARRRGRAGPLARAVGVGGGGGEAYAASSHRVERGTAGYRSTPHGLLQSGYPDIRAPPVGCPPPATHQQLLHCLRLLRVPHHRSQRLSSSCLPGHPPPTPAQQQFFPTLAASIRRPAA